MLQNMMLRLGFSRSADIYRAVYPTEAHNMSQYVLSSNIDSAPTSHIIAATLQPIYSLRDAANWVS
jgi:hypothetical protein